MAEVFIFVYTLQKVERVTQENKHHAYHGCFPITMDIVMEELP